MKHQNVFFRNQITTNFLLTLLISTIFIFTTFVFGQPITFDKLIIDKPVKRTISPGEIHGYQIKVEKDQFAHLKIESPNVQLIETVTLSDGQNVKYARFESPDGFSIKLIAEKADLFRVQLKVGSLAEKGDYTILLDKLRTATDKDKTELTAKMLYDKAFVLEKKGDGVSLKSAIEKYEKALLMWQSINDNEHSNTVLDKLGEIYFRISNYHKSNEYYNQLLQSTQKIGNQDGESKALYGLARNYVSLGNFKLALDYLDQALKIVRRLNDRAAEASILHQIGTVYINLGDYRKAIPFSDQALQIRKDLKDPEAIANSLNNVARIYDQLGEFQKALDYYDESLKICREIGSRDGEKTLLANMGNIYVKFRQYQRALENYEQTLAISKEIGSRFGEAFGLKAIADIHNKMDNKIQALEHYKKSLDLCRSLGIRVGESSNLGQIAMLYADLDSLNAALDYLNQSLIIRKAIKDQQGAALSLYNMALLHYRMDQLDKATDYCNQAFDIAKALENPILLGNIYQNYAAIQFKSGNHFKAKSYIELAVQKAEAVRSSVISQDMRASFFSAAKRSYETLIFLLQELHNQYPDSSFDRLAFQTSEKARCRSFLEMLSEGQIDLRSGVERNLIEREQLIQQQLNQKERSRIKLKNQQAPDSEILAIEQEINKMLYEYEILQTEIRAANPHYAQLSYIQPLNLAEIQERFLDENSVLLEYSLGDSQSYLWAVSKTDLKSYTLPNREAIESAAREVYKFLIARNEQLPTEARKQKKERIDQSGIQLSDAMIKLSQMILSPLTNELEKKRLIIVSEDALQYIPFGVLPVPGDSKELSRFNQKPLIMDHEIIYLPSASVIAPLRHNFRAYQQAKKLIAVFADPVYSTYDSRLKKLQLLATYEPAIKNETEKTDLQELQFLGSLKESGLGRTRSDLSRLPFSRQEANAIVNLAQSENCLCVFDFDANYSTAISKELGNYQIIHFATHGLINSTHPELSGLVLSMFDEQGNPQNGFLSLHNIYKLKLNADLVVLSACQTALGKDVKGEGLIGLTRGFMYAGVPRVVASLWKVDDEATAELMKRFYQFMLGAEQLPAAAALRKAQISIMNEKRWQSPYYWAGFVLQGDWK